MLLHTGSRVILCLDAYSRDMHDERIRSTGVGEEEW